MVTTQAATGPRERGADWVETMLASREANSVGDQRASKQPNTVKTSPNDRPAKSEQQWARDFPIVDAGLKALWTKDYPAELLPWLQGKKGESVELAAIQKMAAQLAATLAPEDELQPELTRLRKTPPTGNDASATRLRLHLIQHLIDYRRATEGYHTAVILRDMATGELATAVAQATEAIGAWRKQLQAAIVNKTVATCPAADPTLDFLAKTSPRLVAQRLRAAGVERVLFTQRTAMNTGHWYESFGYPCDNPNRWMKHTRSRLVILELGTLKETELLADPQGGIRDACLSFDAQRILFAHRPAAENRNHLYEMNVDGTGLRQITRGDDDDIEPAYLPDGDIVFCSSRCRRWVPCLNAPVATLYRCRPDGTGIRPLTANVETENTPWVLPDGRILFMRWEYVERDRNWPHGLWTINPDGTAIMTFWGNMNEGNVFIDAKSIPNTDDVIFIAHPHGSGDKVGRIGILNAKKGPDDKSSIRYLTPKSGLDRINGWRDPYPVAQGLYLACQHNRLYLMDDNGHRALLHTLDPGPDGKTWIHEPFPIQPRPVPPVIPDRSNLAETTGTLFLSKAHVGRNMDGVKPGDIDHLIVLEILPKPVHHTGHTENLSYNGNFFLERILGTVPVGTDGSAFFEVPAMRCLTFVAVDRAGDAVKRMQSFVTLQPGETTSCVGCHDNRLMPPSSEGAIPIALKQRPAQIKPVEGIPGIFHFPRDIQPILDRHCVQCHDNDTRQGNVVLNGDLDPWFNQAYITLRTRLLVRAGFGGVGNYGNLPPRSVGAGASPLYKMLEKGHQDVKLSASEMRMFYFWIESWMQYSGAFAFLNQDDDMRMPVAPEVLEKRCGSCHGDGGNGAPFTRLNGAPPGPADFRETMGLRVNLTHPELSLVLRAPLAVKAGGLGICRQRKAVSEKAAKLGGNTYGMGDVHITSGRADNDKGAPQLGGNWNRGQAEPAANVYLSTQDPDYQIMLASIRKMAEKLLPGRMERPGMTPHKDWVREMQRNGHLAPDFSPQGKDLQFYFDVDEAYYRSFWSKP